MRIAWLTCSHADVGKRASIEVVHTTMSMKETRIFDEPKNLRRNEVINIDIDPNDREAFVLCQLLILA